MSGPDKLSPRQVKLIQGAASILIEKLQLTKEEAVEVISESLKEELKESNVLFEFLEIGAISYRQAFIRKLVQRVEVKVDVMKGLPKEKIRVAIDAFINMLYASWMQQGA